MELDLGPLFPSERSPLPSEAVSTSSVAGQDAGSPESSGTRGPPARRRTVVRNSSTRSVRFGCTSHCAAEMDLLLPGDGSQVSRLHPGTLTLSNGGLGKPHVFRNLLVGLMALGAPAHCSGHPCRPYLTRGNTKQAMSEHQPGLWSGPDTHQLQADKGHSLTHKNPTYRKQMLLQCGRIQLRTPMLRRKTQQANYLYELSPDCKGQACIPRIKNEELGSGAPGQGRIGQQGLSWLPTGRHGPTSHLACSRPRTLEPGSVRCHTQQGKGGDGLVAP